jgi:hypothetical protein
MKIAGKPRCLENIKKYAGYIILNSFSADTMFIIESLLRLGSISAVKPYNRSERWKINHE